MGWAGSHEGVGLRNQQVRRLCLRRGECRGFRGVRLWADGRQTVNLLLARPTGLALEKPWYLIGNAEPGLDLIWSYASRFCCEQLFRDQKSGVFQLAGSGLRDPERIDWLLLVLAITLNGPSDTAAGCRVNLAVEMCWTAGERSCAPA